jgi:ElaA protein
VRDLRLAFKSFDDLSSREVYAILELRQQVFLIEQGAVFLDVDGRDQTAWHLMALAEHGALLGYARIIAAPPGEAARIGRLVLAPQARGIGLGRFLMVEAIRRAEELSPSSPIYIMAQEHLRAFYESLGFIASGTVQDKGGIPHVDMTRRRAAIKP